MKKFIFVLITIISISFTANAQYKMSYQTHDGHEYFFVDKSLGIEDNLDFYTTIVNEYNETRRDIRNQTIGVCVSSACFVISSVLFGVTYRNDDDLGRLLFGSTALTSIIATTIFSVQLGKSTYNAHYQELQLAANGIVISF